VTEDRIIHIARSKFGAEPHEDGCSQPEPESGFGLAGGGYGPYTYCPECGAMLWKAEEEF
jgi:hypothetical protein